MENEAFGPHRYHGDGPVPWDDDLWHANLGIGRASDRWIWRWHAGINFVDAAEMYPVNPISKETVGRTEEILGNWNAANPSRRGRLCLATKHSGEGFMHARGGAPISRETIPEAIEGSLRRLQTDCIDLYQFHWPNRGSYMFRQNWDYAPSGRQQGRRSGRNARLS